MTRRTLLAALTFALTSPTFAADPHAGHAGHGAPAASKSALGDGVVKKIDRTTGMLTVAHGPLPNGMGAMTMAFKVKDRTALEKLKEGQKIRFAIDEAMNITRIE